MIKWAFVYNCCSIQCGSSMNPYDLTMAAIEAIEERDIRRATNIMWELRKLALRAYYTESPDFAGFRSIFSTIHDIAEIKGFNIHVHIPST